MIIGIDFDEVLADFFSAYFLFHNEEYGTSVCKEDFARLDFSMAFGISHEQAMQRVHDFIANGFLDRVSPVLHAQKIIPRLARKHSLHIVTSRSLRFSDVTVKWTKRHFGDVFAGKHFCGNIEGFAHHKEKNEVCQELGAQILIDDHPQNVFLCAADGIEAMLFDQPWNRHVPEGDKITRILSWKDQAILALC